MKIEDEIKQEKFDNDYKKLAVNLIFTQGWVLDKISKILSQFKVTQQQYNVLRILRGQHPTAVTVGLITDRMIQKISDSSRLIDRLVKKGLVDRKMNKADRRKTDLKISAKGLRLLKKIDPETAKFDAIFKHLAKKDVKLLNDLLDKVRG